MRNSILLVALLVAILQGCTEPQPQKPTDIAPQGNLQTMRLTTIHWQRYHRTFHIRRGC